MMSKLWYSLMCIALCCLSACRTQDEVCLRSLNNPCVMGFYTYLLDSLGQPKYTRLELQSASIHLITDQGIDTLYDRAVLSTARIPLDPHRGETIVLFYSDSLQFLPDSIYFRYTVEDVFVDLACGMAQLYTLDTLTSDRNVLDSLKIMNPNLILNNSEENVQVVY